MLEELLAAEELAIRVLYPAFMQHLIREVVHVLQYRQARHQSRRQRRLARTVRINRAERRLEECPIDPASQLRQRMIEVKNLIEPRFEHVVLAAFAPFSRLHQHPHHRARHDNLLAAFDHS
jgi:hypothetical protein